MKKLLLSAINLLFILSYYSCSNEKIEIKEESKLNEIKNSLDFKLFSENYPTLINKVDYSSFSEGEKDGVKIYGIIFRDINKVIGRITFINKNDNFYGIVESYKYNSSNEIVEFEYKSVYNETIISMDAIKNSDETYSLKLKNINNSLKNSSTKQQLSWWNCTKERISGAFSACFGDRDCGWTCGILAGVCVDAIVTAAFISCI